MVVFFYKQQSFNKMEDGFFPHFILLSKCTDNLCNKKYF
jgi:hypothetical protein